MILSTIILSRSKEKKHATMAKL